MRNTVRLLKQLHIAYTMLLLTGCVASSPLVQASLDGDLTTVKSLVSQGASLDTQDCHWGFDFICCTPITCAANKNQTDIVKFLVEHGANIETRDSQGHHLGPLHYAAYRGNLSLVYYLLQKGADVEGTSKFGTPIKLAEFRNHTEVKNILAEVIRKKYVDAQLSGPPQPANTATPTPATALSFTEQIPSGRSAGAYDIAVVIGNANYSATGTPNVDFGLQDARLMKQYLMKTFGYDPANIIYVENATLSKLNEIFGTSDDYQGKLYKWVKPGQSKIFIYYVGHGAPDQQSGEGYFVPVDANPQYIRTSGYKLSTFYENLARIPALKKTVVIDACFSGSSANGQLLKGVSGLTARLKSEHKATAAADLLFTSAGMDQVASWYSEKGHSLFTYFFLKGIQGEADTNKDGRISMGEMRVYLNDKVPYMARRLTGNEQQPVIMGKDGDALVVLTREAQ